MKTGLWVLFWIIERKKVSILREKKNKPHSIKHEKTTNRTYGNSTNNDGLFTCRIGNLQGGGGSRKKWTMDCSNFALCLFLNCTHARRILIPYFFVFKWKICVAIQMRSGVHRSRSFEYFKVYKNHQKIILNPHVHVDQCNIFFFYI